MSVVKRYYPVALEDPREHKLFRVVTGRRRALGWLDMLEIAIHVDKFAALVSVEVGA
jgi:hypothetical protein